MAHVFYAGAAGLGDWKVEARKAGHDPVELCKQTICTRERWELFKQLKESKAMDKIAASVNKVIVKQKAEKEARSKTIMYVTLGVAAVAVLYVVTKK